MAKFSKRLWHWLRNHVGAVAFLFLAFVLSVALQHSSHVSALKLYESQLDSCHRGNLLRIEVNERVNSSRIQRGALIQFLNSAAFAREENYRSTRLRSDLNAAHEYHFLAIQVRNDVHYHAVPLVDCIKVIRKP